MRVEHQTAATVKVQHTTQPVIRLTAKKAFDVCGQHILQGEVFFLVASKGKAGEYHIVRWNEQRGCYKCSCGAGCKPHTHNKAATRYSKALPYKKPIKVVHPWEEVQLPAGVAPVNGTLRVKGPVIAKTTDISTKGALTRNTGFQLMKVS